MSDSETSDGKTMSEEVKKEQEEAKADIKQEEDDPQDKEGKS